MVDGVSEELAAVFAKRRSISESSSSIINRSKVTDENKCLELNNLVDKVKSTTHKCPISRKKSFPGKYDLKNRRNSRSPINCKKIDIKSNENKEYNNFNRVNKVNDGYNKHNLNSYPVKTDKDSSLIIEGNDNQNKRSKVNISSKQFLRVKVTAIEDDIKSSRKEKSDKETVSKLIRVFQKKYETRESQPCVEKLSPDTIEEGESKNENGNVTMVTTMNSSKKRTNDSETISIPVSRKDDETQSYTSISSDTTGSMNVANRIKEYSKIVGKIDDELINLNLDENNDLSERIQVKDDSNIVKDVKSIDISKDISKPKSPVMETSDATSSVSLPSKYTLRKSYLNSKVLSDFRNLKSKKKIISNYVVSNDNTTCEKLSFTEKVSLNKSPLTLSTASLSLEVSDSQYCTSEENDTSTTAPLIEPDVTSKALISNLPLSPIPARNSRFRRKLELANTLLSRKSSSKVTSLSKAFEKRQKNSIKSPSSVTLINAPSSSFIDVSTDTGKQYSAKHKEISPKELHVENPRLCYDTTHKGGVELYFEEKEMESSVKLSSNPINNTSSYCSLPQEMESSIKHSSNPINNSSSYCSLPRPHKTESTSFRFHEFNTTAATEDDSSVDSITTEIRNRSWNRNITSSSKNYTVPITSQVSSVQQQNLNTSPQIKTPPKKIHGENCNSDVVSPKYITKLYAANTFSDVSITNSLTSFNLPDIIKQNQALREEIQALKENYVQDEHSTNSSVALPLRKLRAENRTLSDQLSDAKALLKEKDEKIVQLSDKLNQIYLQFTKGLTNHKPYSQKDTEQFRRFLC